MNVAVLVGRLTKDANITKTGDNLSVARFTLAVNRRFQRDGGQDQADFISCVAFGKTAEFIENYTHKGTKLAVNGRIQTGSYTNNEGQRVYTTDVVVESCEFVESKNAEQNGGNSNQITEDSNDDFMKIDTKTLDDMPF